MNWFDFAIIATLALSILVGLWRGFIGEVMALACWVLAFWVAWMFGPSLADRFSASISVPSVRVLLAYALCFVAVLDCRCHRRLPVAQAGQRQRIVRHRSPARHGLRSGSRLCPGGAGRAADEVHAGGPRRLVAELADAADLRSRRALGHARCCRNAWRAISNRRPRHYRQRPRMPDQTGGTSPCKILNQPSAQ